MKYLLIITTLLLMNCADDSTGQSNLPQLENKTYCSVEKWNNGDFKEIYTFDPNFSYDSGYAEVIEVHVDSLKSDSIFVSNRYLKAVIVDEKYSETYNIYRYNVLNEFYPEEEMYIQSKEFVKCDE